MSTIQKINLLTVNGRPSTTSRKIAKHFKKLHYNVLRDIENLACSPQFTDLNFEVSEYKDVSGKLAGQYKEAYINSSNQMGQQLKNTSKTAL